MFKYRLQYQFVLKCDLLYNEGIFTSDKKKTSFNAVYLLTILKKDLNVLIYYLLKK